MMPELVQLPENTHIRSVGRFTLVIENHVVTSRPALFVWALHIMRVGHWDRALLEIKSSNISYEAFVECCAAELEDDNTVFINTLDEIFRLSYMGHVAEFSTSYFGRRFAEKLAEKLRGCDGWSSFYLTMNGNSNFILDMVEAIKKDMREFRHIHFYKQII